MNNIYEVVSIDSGTWVTEYFYSEPELGEKYRIIGQHYCERTRAELQGAPILDGLCGPMYNGEEQGRTVIRYETQEVYNMMSN